MRKSTSVITFTCSGTFLSKLCISYKQNLLYMNTVWPRLQYFQHVLVGSGLKTTRKRRQFFMSETITKHPNANWNLRYNIFIWNHCHGRAHLACWQPDILNKQKQNVCIWTAGVHSHSVISALPAEPSTFL